MDRYGLAREFELRKFEMQVMNMTDLYQVQEIAIRAIQSDDQPTEGLRGHAAGHGPPATRSLNLRTCG